MTKDIRLVSAWRSALARAKSKQATELASVTSYSETTRGYLAQYDELRSETSDWIDGVDSSGATYAEAYQFLGDQAAARQRIDDSIDALDAPGPVAGANSELSDVLTEATQAMEDAYSGVADYQYDYSYTYYKETPGWQQFEASSEDISSAYASAEGNWEAAVAEYTGSVEDRPMPKPPAI